MIHVYTGDGKGKTTAALGLAIRAAGRGKKVVIVQFMKGADTGELHSLALLPGITALRNKKQHGFFNRVDAETQSRITEDNNSSLEQALGLPWDMLILDEVFSAYSAGALDRKTIDSLVVEKNENRELVLTGRNPPRHIIEAADYVSEIRKIKHPYDLGAPAREGIEY
jgi:cob(I)alamin adenosyltransferase